MDIPLAYPFEYHLDLQFLRIVIQDNARERLV